MANPQGLTAANMPAPKARARGASMTVATMVASRAAVHEELLG